MSRQEPAQGDQFPTTQDPGRAWWWLPAEERRRRKRRQQEWKAYLRRHGQKKKDSDLEDYLPPGCSGGGSTGGGCRGGGRNGDGCGGGGGCDGPCLIGLFPVMMAAGLRFALGGGRTRRAAQRTDPAAPPPRGLVAGVLYGAVHHYRTEISPGRAACCPYTPTCSTYAVQALHRHGALRGARLTAGRLLRCRPGAARRGGGVDPVPER
ncbi:membrane protein insertion efficiency factor YidD [Kitasatospora sp. NPDC015120]|uniref:membrane protein insertion efficiency factor YidD n=1 Tax=Kitasatospora sp. NPDC015120 TaxID=3364023 RepID=UPI0036F486A5